MTDNVLSLQETKEFKPNIILCSTTRFNIKKITNVNGDDIYQVDMGDCLRYITPDTDYIGIIYSDTLYIFNLKEDEVFSKDFLQMLKEEIPEITPETIKMWGDGFENFININDLITLYPSLYNSNCPSLISLDSAKQIINELNTELNKTCPSFKLNIDYVFNLKEESTVVSFADFLTTVPDDLLLCLFNDNKCVSSVSINISKDTLDITSKTHIRYEGRKFNKLLRSVIIIIAKNLDESIQFIKSSAINPISAFLMLKSFNAISKNDEGEIILDKTSTFENIKTAIEESEYSNIDSIVELNEENIENAKAVFNSTIESINCGPLAGGNMKTRRKSKKNKSKKNNFNKRKSKKNKFNKRNRK
jgi:disulfide oxidoreductase YuzD